jgi:hypothetical protein
MAWTPAPPLHRKCSFLSLQTLFHLLTSLAAPEFCGLLSEGLCHILLNSSWLEQRNSSFFYCCLNKWHDFRSFVVSDPVGNTLGLNEKNNTQIPKSSWQ